jgi:hypothetical protein
MSGMTFEVDTPRGRMMATMLGTKINELDGAALTVR